MNKNERKELEKRKKAICKKLPFMDWLPLEKQKEIIKERDMINSKLNK